MSQSTPRVPLAPTDDSPAGGWGLRTRLLGAILVVALTTIGVGAFGIVRMASLSDRADRVYTDGALPVAGLQQLQTDWWQLMVHTARANIVTLPADARASAQQKAGDAAQTLTEDTASVGELPMSPETRASYGEFVDASQAYLTDLQLLVASATPTGSTLPLAEQQAIITRLNAKEAVIAV